MFPSVLDETLPAKDWAELEALDRIDPFGPERGDLRMGVLASLIANVHRDPKKTGAFKPIDFMPFVPEADRQKAADRALEQKLIAALKPVRQKKS